MVVCSRMQTSGIVLICIFLSTVNSLRDIDGVQVDGINFNPVCATGAACWEISITYRLSQGHWYSMYIPKSVSQPSGDSNSAKSTFDPDFFPCNAFGKGAQASTICCLADVMADYHPLGNALLRIERTLGEDVATFGATTCLDDTAIPSFGGAHGLSLPATEIEGNFLGLTSKIIPKMVLDAELGVYQAVVLLDENELLSSTGMVVSDVLHSEFALRSRTDKRVAAARLKVGRGPRSTQSRLSLVCIISSRRGPRTSVPTTGRSRSTWKSPMLPSRGHTLSLPHTPLLRASPPV
eukprot:2886474-Rhodomonas_salina.1